MSFPIDTEPYTELYIESYTDVYRYGAYGYRVLYGEYRAIRNAGDTDVELKGYSRRMLDTEP